LFNTQENPDMPLYPMIDQLKGAMNQLPLVSADLPGIGGTLKAVPEHFEVEEMLPYAPCGQGEHVYATLRRAGWNTVDVASTLAHTFDLKPMDVGWGGRKDKRAITTQTFSLALPLSLRTDQIEARLAVLPFEVLAVSRHRNKIKTGHVAGNRFRILVTGTVADGLQRSRAIAQRLAQVGLPNYFGPQRFGFNMSNLDRAVSLLSSGKNARGSKDSFWVSSLQAALFNLWLKERIHRNVFGRIMKGDIAQKTDTGGLFVVDDPIEANERFARRAIVYTGPIFGHKMMTAEAESGAYETDLMDRFELSVYHFKRLRAQGSRRAAVLHLTDLTLEAAEEGIHFAFSLPSGAYATTVLAEFMHDGAMMQTD
jgi:tRNA pseudouridine13 synthase